MTATHSDIQKLEQAVGLYHLEILGIVASEPSDPVPDDTRSIALLGPAEPGFWLYFCNQPEYLDSAPDPVDRWSCRVISSLANALDGTAVLPFTGPPYAPFISWAVRSGRAWVSPVGLLVHDTSGLMLSFRGAVCLPYLVEQYATLEKPCLSCDKKPCVSACPVSALTGNDYDLPACHGYLDTNAGLDCLGNGCAVRRACPVSKSYGRSPLQSAHHMKAFHP